MKLSRVAYWQVTIVSQLLDLRVYPNLALRGTEKDIASAERGRDSISRQHRSMKEHEACRYLNVPDRNIHRVWFILSVFSFREAYLHAARIVGGSKGSSFLSDDPTRARGSIQSSPENNPNPLPVTLSWPHPTTPSLKLPTPNWPELSSALEPQSTRHGLVSNCVHPNAPQKFNGREKKM